MTVNVVFAINYSQDHQEVVLNDFNHWFMIWVNSGGRLSKSLFYPENSLVQHYLLY